MSMDRHIHVRAEGSNAVRTGPGRDECEHGSLRRKCELCERDDAIRDLKRALVTAKDVLERALADYRGEVPPDGLAAWQQSILRRLQAAAVRYLQTDGSHGAFDALELAKARAELVGILGSIPRLSMADLAAPNPSASGRRPGAEPCPEGS